MAVEFPSLNEYRSQWELRLVSNQIEWFVVIVSMAFVLVTMFYGLRIVFVVEMQITSVSIST